MEITCLSLEDFHPEQLSVLYQQARYCQAMTEADTAAMREMIDQDMVFTHMSGRQQSREEYLADIENGSLRYFTIGMEKPVVAVDGDLASVTFTSVLNASAYGVRGTYRMSGTHWYEKRDGDWIAINNP
ncbi:MAG: nuclear transport factor 2 family protein, partial [Oscillospiraceae bacterium]|nr:nuclear transport factor 2 family protein [Oscillospiraceae bacterium]